MKATLLNFTICAALLASCAAEPRDAVSAHPGMRLVWHDEFDVPGPVNAADWVYEQGLVRNREAQWYQPANVTCRDGLLVIEARRERVANPEFDTSKQDWKHERAFSEYTSGSIKTRGRHEWLYGRFEMRARIDVRPGLWPAFWTVGTARPWPACGEIDIMEFFKGTLLANAAWASARPWKASWKDSRTPIEEVAKPLTVPEWAGQFHVWSMMWDEQSIRLEVDGRVLNEIDLSHTVNETEDRANPFHEPQHIILNLAVGGTSGGDPAATEFPAKFEVDWVRVYQSEVRTQAVSSVPVVQPLPRRRIRTDRP
jgi:beta-glucanase (GH16 family)